MALAQTSEHQNKAELVLQAASESGKSHDGMACIRGPCRTCDQPSVQHAAVHAGSVLNRHCLFGGTDKNCERWLLLLLNKDMIAGATL